jgi:hypothetical protein
MAYPLPSKGRKNNLKRGGRAKAQHQRGSFAEPQHLIAAGKKSTARLDPKRREAGGALTTPGAFDPPPRWSPPRGAFVGVGQAASGRASSPPPDYWEPPMGSQPERPGGRAQYKQGGGPTAAAPPRRG